MTASPDHRSHSALSRAKELSHPAHNEDAALKKPRSFAIRIADVWSLRSDGSLSQHHLKVPALPIFDAALSAFARGTVFQSEKGPVAIEDLLPGDRLITARGEASEVKWIGSSLFSTNDLTHSVPLTRIMADSFGVSRPDTFLNFGPAARILQTPPHLRSEGGQNQILVPAQSMIDGTNVIQVSPPTPVRLYHLGLHRHAAVLASGLEVETYHPGPHPTKALSNTLCSVFTALFPHLKNAADFGPLTYLRAPDERESSLS